MSCVTSEDWLLRSQREHQLVHPPTTHLLPTNIDLTSVSVHNALTQQTRVQRLSENKLTLTWTGEMCKHSARDNVNVYCLYFATLLQGHRDFPFGNSRESAIPKIPGGNSRELLNSRRKFPGISKISNFS